MRSNRLVLSFLRTGLCAATIFAALAGGAMAGTPASTATDVCPDNANPCDVTAVFDVANNAVLDFGTRALNVSGSGQFNFAGGNGQVLCGPFSATTTNPTFDANGPSEFGGTTSGNIVVSARRRCSSGVSPPACASVSGCQFGTCGVRRCSLKPGQVCLNDTNCQLGICGANKRCSGSVKFVRCATNVDCDYGTCPAQLTCSNKSTNPLNCAANADCDFGTCSIGTASLTLNGTIAGNSDSPASITLNAADNISFSKLINISSSSVDSDGGYLAADSAFGSVTQTGKINATGGGTSQGGSVEFYAATDVTVGEDVDVVGGDFDGGSVDISAGRDVFINRSLLANSSAGAGFGGEIVVDAGRHLVVTGVSAVNKTTIETNGHTDIENFAGDGGTQDYTAGGNLTLNANTRYVGLGSQPDGAGSDIFIDVTGDMVMDGDITIKAVGGQGSGGYLEILSGGKTTVGSVGVMDVTGNEGGYVEFSSSGNTDFRGKADASGATTQQGLGGLIYLDSEFNTVVSGTLLVNSSNSGSLEVDACRVTLTGTGKFDNKVINGDNTILARESMKLLSGSVMAVGTGGTNTLIYRTPAKPPVTSGTITPAPRLIVDPSLPGCPVCGNSEIDKTETCDDGNVNNGDGCSSDCQNEKCLAQTGAPGYPNVPLCDDGNVCTTDVCNTLLAGGTCQHPAKNCDDAIACTTDSCNPESGVCLHAPVDGVCNDSNPCTTNFCSSQLGCSATANNNACNDGDNCTENDVCGASMCHGTSIPGCAVCGDGIATPPEELCDDGNNTFTSGEYCGVGCVRIPCGKPTNSSGGLPKSSDALFALKSAVGQSTCTIQVCDVDSSGKVLASDAQRILKAAVGQPIVLSCPAP